MAKKSAKKATAAPKPKVFIGSSTEGRQIARAISSNLESVAEPHIWEHIFDLSETTVETLEKMAKVCQFAVFVLTPDDEIKFRGAKLKTARDNVLWEHGLFSGKNGTKSTFIVMPGDIKNLKLPTDLLGFTTATYDSSRSDGNLDAMVTTPCLRITQAIGKAMSTQDSLTGEWKSFWLPVDPHYALCLTETMTITAVHGRVQLKNSGNPNFNWEGSGVIEHDSHIVGEWHSLRGPAVGAFVLTRTGREHFLYGYIIGDNPQKQVKPGPFLLGKTYKDVSEGIDLLRECWNRKILEDLGKLVRQAANGVKPGATDK